MKKIWEVIKKIGIWIATVIVAIFTVLFVKEQRDKVVPTGSTTSDDNEEINAKAEAKRKETVERISNADARSICESYGSVCDTIAEGKDRFRRRCKRTDN